MRRSLTALVLCALLAGCGVGAGEGTEGVSLTVTRDFGAQTVGAEQSGTPKPSGTVMQLLQGGLEVDTRYGGKFVQGIEGYEGGRRDGRPVDWFYYVNGIEAEVGAAEQTLSPGDRVWWDYHDWSETMRIPAVVGSFPEPFLSGRGGKRLPVRVECADDAERECEEVTTRMADAGITQLARARLATHTEGEVLRILVGRWAALRLDPTVAALERGPGTSGVYARLDRSGGTLSLLDATGNVARELGAGSGLLAATRYGDQVPVWIVTGTDEAGVAAAAGLLTEDALQHRFAVAVERGRAIPLPVKPAGSP
jgi:hypothetical protein